MSWQAMGWALTLSPAQLQDVSPSAHITLIALANCADTKGRHAFPSAQTLADQRYCDVRTIRRHLQALEDAGLILRGDQSLVRQLRKDRRPIVWDMAMQPGDNSVSRGDTDVTPPEERGDTLWSNGVTPDVLQTTQNHVEKVTYSHPGTRGDTDVTPSEIDDMPDRECIHGHPAVWFINRRNRDRREPKCPECRHVRRITLMPIEEPAHA